MTNEHQNKPDDSAWSGRLAAILILAFVGVVLVLMFFAVRGPR